MKNENYLFYFSCFDLASILRIMFYSIMYRIESPLRETSEQKIVWKFCLFEFN